jgi:phosphoribosyl 1,2-cyclic phosphate phosphodiesterase
MEVLGFRIGDFTYITDANEIPTEELDKIYGSNYLVLNALRREKHISHFTLA